MEIEDARNHALTLAGAGLPVFPCRWDKAPACPRGFHVATDSPTAIRQLWRQWPGPLVGVPTGAASGLAVLDIDPRGKGDTWLQERWERLPRTRVHATRSHGFHLLFRAVPGLRCSAGRIAPGVDVRAEGGYVIWWPAAGLAALDEAPPAPWPEWLQVAGQPPRLEPQRAAANLPGAAARQGLLRAVAGAAPGQRNSVAYWAACRLREQVDAGHLGEELAVELVAQAAQRAGLSPAEAYRTARSGIGRR